MRIVAPILIIPNDVFAVSIDYQYMSLVRISVVGRELSQYEYLRRSSETLVAFVSGVRDDILKGVTIVFLPGPTYSSSIPVVSCEVT